MENENRQARKFLVRTARMLVNRCEVAQPEALRCLAAAERIVNGEQVPEMELLIKGYRKFLQGVTYHPQGAIWLVFVVCFEIWQPTGQAVAIATNLTIDAAIAVRLGDNEGHESSRVEIDIALRDKLRKEVARFRKDATFTETISGLSANF